MLHSWKACIPGPDKGQASLQYVKTTAIPCDSANGSTELFDQEIVAALVRTESLLQFWFRYIEDFMPGILSKQLERKVLKYPNDRLSKIIHKSLGELVEARNSSNCRAAKNIVSHMSELRHEYLHKLCEAAVKASGSYPTQLFGVVINDGVSKLSGSEPKLMISDATQVQNLLVAATIVGNNTLAKQLIINGTQDIHTDFGTALEAAAGRGDVLMTQYILENSTIEQSATSKAFTAACYSGHLQVLELFYQPKYHITVDTSTMILALTRAVSSGHEAIIDYLFLHDPMCGIGKYVSIWSSPTFGRFKYEPFETWMLLIAIMKGQFKLVRRMLQQGAYPSPSLNYRSSNFPVEYAVRVGDLNVMRELHSAGRGLRPQTPVASMQVAARAGWLAVTEFLIHAGVPV
jgi:hypothetical protein